jgi:hypothetical protein
MLSAVYTVWACPKSSKKKGEQEEGNKSFHGVVDWSITGKTAISQNSRIMIIRG